MKGQPGIRSRLAGAQRSIETSAREKDKRRLLTDPEVVKPGAEDSQVAKIQRDWVAAAARLRLAEPVAVARRGRGGRDHHR